MKTLKKIKLNGLNDAELRDREMDALNGGDRTCGCGCNYEGSGGSTAQFENLGELVKNTIFVA